MSELSAEEMFLRAIFGQPDPSPPCGIHCPGDCGWNPDDPEDPCNPDPSESA